MSKTHHHSIQPNEEYSVAYWEAHRAQLDLGPAFNIQDTASNIAAALNALNTDSHIAQIVISDNASVTVSVSQLTGDAAALSKLINENSTAAALTVSDTGANIQASFATIATEGQVTKIVISDNSVVTLTASQAAYTTAVGELVNANLTTASVHVKDTAANLATNLNAIQTDGSAVTEVIVSNSTAMTLTAQQVSLDAGALAKVVYNNGGTVQFKVNDTGANIGTYLNALEAQTKISTITDTNNAAITLTVAQITSDSGALAKVVNANAGPYTLVVADNAADVAGGVSGLNGNSHVSSIAISDSSADVVSNLNALAGITKTMTIALTDGGTPTLMVTDTQFINDSAVLNDITSAYSLTVTSVTAAGAAAVYANSHVASFVVTDNSTNVQNGIDSLESYASKISSVTLSDGGTPTMTISYTQYANDGAILGKISGSWGVDVTNATAAQAGLISGAAHVSEIYVVDTAADIGSLLTTLLGVAQAGHLGGIVVSDAGTITTSEATYTESASVFADITGSYAVALTSVVAADASSLAAADSHIISLAIGDSAHNVQQNLDSLESVASKITTIALTDGGTPTITITDTQFTNDATVLGDIAGAYNLSVTGVTVAGAAALYANSHVASFVVTDSSTNVQSGIDSLESYASKISSITLTDGGTPALTISEAQYHNDTTVLDDISGGFTLALTGVLAADAAGLAGATVGDGTVTQLYVSDTATNIASSLSSLDGADVVKIVISNGSAIQIDVASLEVNGTALGKLYASDGADQGTVTIYDTASAITGDLAGLNSDLQVTKIVVSDNGLTAVTIGELTSYSHALNELYESDGTTPAQLTVTDTASNISGAFDTLNGASRVSQVIVSDSGSGGVVTIDATQAANDAAALSELYLANGIAHAQAAVSDSSGNVQSNLDGLEANHSYISSITLTDGGTPTLTITETQYHNDATVLGDIAGSYQLVVTSALAADAATISGGSHVTSVSVTDTAANIASNFDALNGIGTLVAINVQDAAEVTLSAYSAATDTYAESILAGGTNAGHVAVSDTAANVVAYATELNANSYVNQVHVIDSATNVASNLGGLNSVTNLSIALSDVGTPVMTITAAELTSDTAALDAISNASFDVAVTYVLAANAGNIAGEVGALTSHATLTSITVFDTNTNIASAFDALNGLAHLTEISVGNSPGGHEVTLSAASALADTTAEGLLYDVHGNPMDVAVSDTAANVAGNASGLNGNAHIDHVYVVDSAFAVASNLGGLNSVNHLSITLNDGGTPLLTITESQLAGDATALDAIANASFDIAVTNVLAADASSIAGDVSALTSHATLTSITVDDTAAHIASAFSSLNTASDLTKIVVSDSGSNEVTLSVASVLANTTAEGLLYNSNGSTPAKIAVADTAVNIANNLNAIQSDSQINNVYVADTAANISSELVSLSGLSYLTGILVTDGGTLSVTGNDLTTYASTIGLITNSTFNIAVTSALAADASSIAGEVTSANSHAVLTSITVDDIAANISSAFDSLNGVAHLTQIIVTDSGPNEVTVSAESAANDTAVESVLYQSNGSAHANFAVSDTAANVAEYLSELNGLSSLSAINLTGGTLAITETQLENDTAALGKITTAGFTVAVTNVLAADAGSIAGEVTAVNSEAVLTSISVTDTAADIAAAFDTLNSTAAVTKIIVSDSGSNEVTLSASSALADTAAESALYQSNGSTRAHVAVADNAANVAADAANLNANGHIDHVYVTDSAANVVSNLGELNGVDNLSITLTGSGTPSLTITETELTTDTDALGAITNSSFDIAVTSVLASDVGNIASGIAAANAHATLTSISVSDTAANVSAAFNTLNTTAHVTQVVVSDSGLGNEVTISVAQLADTALLGELYNSDGATRANLAVSDTAADITAALSTLNSDLQVNKIVVSDNGLTAVSIAQLTTYAHALNELYDSNGVTPASLTVTDTAANVSAAIDTLNGASRVTKIIVGNSGTGGVVTIDIAQAGDTHALSELYQADGTDHAYVTVADTASNISVDFGDLVNNPYVNKFEVTDNAALTITANQATGYSAAFGEFLQSNGSTPAIIDVVDTASHIAANFDNLGGIGLTRIIVSDSGANEVTLSASSAVGDTAVEGILYQSNGTSPANVAVLDTAADISGVLDQLNSNAHVDHIIISDDGSIGLGAASAVNDSHALGELANEDHSPVTLVINDTAANITTYLDQLNSIAAISSVVINDSNPLVLGAAQLDTDSTVLGKLAPGSSIDVSDTGANISAYLDAIAANSDVVSIVDNNDAALTVTVDQLGTYSAVLSEITNSDDVTPATIYVEDTAANIELHIADLNGNSTPQEIIISDNAALALSVAEYTGNPSLLARLQNADSSPYTLNISDNGANISAALDSLGGDSHIVTITDTNEAAITLSVAQITSDAAALGILVNGDGSPYTLSVNDLATNLTTALDSLNLNSHVTSLVVTDNGSGNEVVVSVGQLTTDAHALAELYTDGTLTTLANVTVSDSAANLSGATFDALNNDGQVDHIIVSDSGLGNEVTINVAQLGDTQALNELYTDGSFTTLATVTVSDTAHNLSYGALDALSSNDQVDHIVVNDSGSGNEVAICVAELQNDGQALGELYTDNTFATLANVIVKDSAANISTAFDTLDSAGQVNKIVVGDSGSGNEVTISIAQLGDTAALAELYNADGSAAEVTISDTSAAISADFDNLNGNLQVNKIVAYDDGISEVTITVAQLGDTRALGELYQSDGSTLAEVRISDSAANISTAFDALNGNSRVDSIVVNDGNEVTISVAQLGDTTALGELYQGTPGTPAHVAVSDIAANLSGAAFDTLNGNTQVDKIIVSDSGSGGEVAISVSQYTNDTTALGELYNANGSAAHVAISDTASNLTGSALDTLNGADQVDRIIVSDSGTGGEVSVTVGQLGNDATALGELYNADGSSAHVAVNDLAANLSGAEFDALNANSQVDRIVVNDSGTGGEVSVSVSQLGTDTTALDELYNADGSAAHVAISDTASAIQGDLDGLNGNPQVDNIYVTDTPDFTLSAVTVGTDARALSLIGADNSGVTIEVTDTGSNITTYLDALEANTDITSITISDNAAITVTAAQLLSTDVDAIGLLVNADAADYPNVMLVVEDSAADISAHLSDLAGYSSAGREITSVVISDNAAVQVTVDQLTSDGAMIDELSNADGSPYQLNIAGNAAEISAALDTLEAYAEGAHVAAITVDGNEAVTVSVGQITSDATALSKLVNENSSPYTLAVRDLATNVAGDLNALNSNSHVTSILLTDGGTPTLGITESQLSDTTALGEITNGVFDVAVTNVLAADASGIEARVQSANGDAVLTSISVTDSAANVGANIGALNGLASLTAINLTGGTLAITETALTSDATALSLINTDNGSYNVAVTNVLAADAAGIAAEVGAYSNATLTSISVTDSGANVGANIGSLNGLAHLTAINLTGGALTITESALANDGTALALINTDNGSYNVAVTNVLAADASGIAAEVGAYSHATLTSISVTDTGANVGANIGSLNGLAHLTAINLTGGALTITESALANDGTALALINTDNGSYNVAVTNVLAADASGIAAEVGAYSHATLTSISVTDTGANVGANIGSLNGLAHLTAINLTGGALTITESALANDGTALALINTDNGSYNVAVTNVLAADASGIAAEVGAYSHATLTSISVTDTAADVQASIASLETLATGGTLTSITLTDGGAPTITLTETAYNADGAALADIVSAYHLTITGVLAADAAGIAVNTHVTSILVVDSASDVQASIASLETLATAGTLTSITLADGSTPTITLSETAYGADSAALGKIVSNYDLAITNVLAADAGAIAENGHVTSIAVYDTGANISAALDALNGNSDVTTIVISNNAALNLAAHSAATDSHALGLLHNQNGDPVTLTVTDTAANIATYLDALNSISTISAITISDNNPLTLQAYQVATDATALGRVENSNGQPIVINVSDLAANISTYLNQLEANNYIGAITVSDNLSVTVSASQLSTDSDVLAALINANGSAATVAVLDTAANISADLGSLNSDSQVTSIVISDNAQLLLTVAQVVSDTRALGELSDAGGGPVTEKVSDSANNISSNFNALQADAQITSIVVSNNSSLTLSAGQVANDASALSKVVNKNGSAYKLVISDTAANISANIDALQANGHIVAMYVTDNGTVTVTYSQLQADSGVLYDIQGTHYLDVTNVTGQSYSSFTETINGNHQVTQESLYGSNGTLIESIAYTYNGNGTLATESITGIQGQAYSSIVETFGSNGKVANEAFYYSNGNLFENVAFTYNGDGTVATETITGIQGQPYTSLVETFGSGGHLANEALYESNGSLYENLAFTYNNNGSLATEAITGIQGQAYSSIVETFASNGKVSNEAFYYANGSLDVNYAFTYNGDGSIGEVITGLTGITSENILLDSSGHTENIFIYNSNNTVAAYFYETSQTFTSNGETTTLTINNGTANDTFNFNGSFGNVSISGYVPGSEFMNFDHNDFANIAAVEAASTQVGNNVVVRLDAHDTITLQGITLATWEAHTSDWHFI